MRIKKLLLCAALLLPLFCLPVFADIASETGADGIWETLPEEVVDGMKGLGIESIDVTETEKMDVLSFLSALRPSLSRAVKNPLRASGVLLGMLLLCLLLGSLTGEEHAALLGRTEAAVCALLLLPSVTDAMTRLTALSTATGAFLRGCVPACAGLAVTCGRPASAAVSSAFLLSVCSLLETAADKGLLPLSGMLFALAAVTSTEQSPVSAFADLLFRVLKWGLGVVAALAGGLFALQNGIAAAKDSLSLRSAKFAVSGLVPFVGGVLSEALGTVKASASVIRTGVGTVVLLALLLLLLPPLLELFLWQTTLRLLSFFAGSCGASLTERLFSRTAGVFSVLIAALSLTTVLLLFAAAVLVKAGG